jgi:signal transduction histidine kinase
VAVAPIHGDANLLRQVLDNLVQNACQAMADGGTLTLRAEPAREAGEDGVAIEIGDTGEGIDTQIRSRVGTPFFTTRPSGTGLGLAICDRIVTAHGGTLSIESRSGEGTVVRVFLPAGRTSEAPGVRPATAFVGSAPPGRSKAATDARAASESTPPTIATTFEG